MDGVAATAAWLDALDWPGAAAFAAANRTVLRRPGGGGGAGGGGGDVPYGWVKGAEGLTFAVLSDAGHMAPHDSPKAAADMITRFVRGGFA